MSEGLIDAVCVHSYNNDGVGRLEAQQLRQVRAMQRAVRAADSDADEDDGEASSTRVWCGECGPHNEGGVPNVTDRSADAFWYLDALGSLAALGVAEFGRQALVGSHYGLLDVDNAFEPNPDFYVLVLWTKLMGHRVLRVDAPAADDDAEFRAYAHCAPPPSASLAIAFVNVADTARDVRLDVLGATVGAERDEWHLRAPPGEDTSKTLLLNGRPLETKHDDLPALDPLRARGPLVVAPRSFGFATLGPVPACAADS